MNTGKGDESLSGKKVININAHGKYSTGNIASSITENLNNGSMFLHSRGELGRDYAINFGSKFQMLCDVAMTRLTGVDSVWSWNNTRKILKVIKREKPDIIHMHNLHGFYINYRRLFRYIKKHKIKAVWTLHDCWSFTGHCPYFDLIGCEAWKTQCRECPLYKETYLKSRYFDLSKSNFKRKKNVFCGVENMTIVTPSEWLAGLVKQSFLRDYPVVVINNGINTDKFRIRANETFKDVIPADKKVVIAVANGWEKRKGFGDVVEVSRRLPDDYVIIMVGVSQNQKKQLVGEKIIAISRTENQQQLAELYSSADVFINTTYEDNYPTVNIEALCCGCPIVTYDTGGCAETVCENNGIVVPKGNIDIMVSAIKQVVDRKFDREAISQAARAKHPHDDMIKKYVELYEHI